MKLRVTLLCFAVAAACLFMTGSAFATNLNLNPNGVWNVFDDAGVCNGCFFPETWTATANENVLLTDLLVVGDSYGVYLNGGFVFDTPSVPDWTFYGSDPFGYPFTTSPNVAYGSGLFSSVTFFVPAGTIITLTELSLPPTFTDGTYAIMATPEPSTFVMLSSGLIGLAGIVRRKFRV